LAKVAFRQFDASVGASGPRDFAVRMHAPSSEAPPASIASRPAFVTIANRPSVGRDGKRHTTDLRFGKTEMFFRKGLDRAAERGIANGARRANHLRRLNAGWNDPAQDGWSHRGPAFGRPDDKLRDTLLPPRLFWFGLIQCDILS